MSGKVPTVGARRKIGEILIDAGVLDDLQLRSALGHQRQWGGRLGHILIDLKLIDEHTLAQTLAGQLGLELCDLSGDVDIEIVRMLPQSVAERHAVFPVRFDSQAGGGTLTVAFSDPTNLTAIDEVRFQTGKTIQLAVASEGQIAQAIRRFYYGEDPSTEQPAAEHSALFGGVDGFLAPEDEELAELEPIPSDSQIPQTGAPNAGAFELSQPELGAPEAPTEAPPDPLAGFFETAPPPSPDLAAAQMDAPPPAATLPARSTPSVTPPSRPLPSSPPLAAPPMLGRTPSAGPVPLPLSAESRPTFTPRSKTPIVAEVSEMAQQAEDFLSQAVDFSKETVEGIVLPAGFLRPEPQAVVAKPAVTPRAAPASPPLRPTAVPVAPPAPVRPPTRPVVTPAASPASRPAASPAATPVATPAASPPARPLTSRVATPIASPGLRAAKSPIATPGARPAASPAAAPPRVLAPTREMPLMADLAALSGDTQEPTRPGVSLAELLGKSPTPAAAPAAEQTREPTQPAIQLSDLQPPPAPIPLSTADAVENAFDITFGEPSKPFTLPEGFASPVRGPAPSPSPAAKPDFSPDFSDDDLGAALSGLENPKPDGAQGLGTARPFLPSDGNYAQALARLLIKKGLIDEAELLAALAEE